MISPARTSALSLVVHAVDSTGALCGARPHGPQRKPGDSRWRLSSRMPVNCPRCLMKLGGDRWALCETPTAHSMSPVHVRRVGHEGISMSGNAAGSKTLCNLTVGWDLRELESLETCRQLRDVCGQCKRVALAPHLRENRDAPSSHAVR